MNKLKKGLLFFSVTLLSLFTLIACNSNKDLEKAYKALNEDVIVSEGDSLSSVTKDLNLVTKIDKYENVKITWSSNNLEVISIEGKVVRQEKDVEVKLTAKLTLDKKEKLKEFNVVVIKKEKEDLEEPEEIEIISINDFINLEEGSTGTIKGVITSFAMYNSFALEDETGSVALRIDGLNAASEEVNFKVGSKVTAKVEKNIFNGLIQATLVDGENVEVDDETYDLPKIVEIDSSDLSKDTLIKNQAKRVKISNLLVKSHNVDNFGNVIMTLINSNLEEISFRADSRIAEVEGLKDIKVDQIIEIDGGVLGWFNDPQIMVENSDQVKIIEGNDEINVIKAYNKLSLVSVVTEEIKLDLVKEIDNVSIAWDVLDGKDLIDLETGQITLPSESAVLKLKATLSKNDYSKTKEFEVSVIAKSEEDIEFHETFENMELPKSYTNFKVDGVNGVIWEVVHGRDQEDFSIDGQGILLRRSNEPSSLTATFKNGIKDFSFEYRKAYTGGSQRNYSVDVTNNGKTTTYDLPVFGEGSGEQEDIHKFSQVLNLEGEVTIKIYATGKEGNQQAVFDNFKWTE